jgi:hypothetical protein
VAREILDVEGIARRLCLTKSQVYHLVRRKDDPLPYRKCGKQLRFSVDRVWRWFDRQPGTDGEDI